jgi:sugar/nucleoside kinase (ribokinase family)
LCERADVVICTGEDARDVFGIDAAAGAAAVEVARRFGVGTVIVTAGAEGVWLAREGDTELLPAIPTTTIDRVGAGDAFCAGVIVGLLEGDVRTGVRLGQAAASLKHTMRGDQYVGTRADAEALLGPSGRSVGR